MARGTKSRTTARVTSARSTDVLRSTWPVSSARAMASNWLTMCAARCVDSAICRSECFIDAGSPRPLSISRAASSACMRRPASGVLSWCAASARKWRCVAMVRSSRSSRSLMAVTSGATSSGTSATASGLRSVLSRLRMRCCSSARGRMPRARANHTSSTASGRITNCGRITPLMISVASCERLPSVSATWTSASLSASGRAARAGQPQVGHAHRFFAQHVVAEAHAGFRRRLDSRHRQGGIAGQQFTAAAQHLVVDMILVVAPRQRLRRALQQGARVDRRLRAGGGGLHTGLTRQRQRQVGQFAVVGAVGDGLRHDPGQAQAHGPQQQQRRQHPVEDLAEQRTLLASAGLGNHGASPSAGAVGFKPGSSPGNSPAHAPWRCAPGPVRSSCAGGGCRPRWRCCSPLRPTRTGAPPAGPC
jgi:hypothetical protein